MSQVAGGLIRGQPAMTTQPIQSAQTAPITVPQLPPSMIMPNSVRPQVIQVAIAFYFVLAYLRNYFILCLFKFM